MSDIKNMTQLRDHSLQVLKKLSEGKISIHEAAVTAKISEGIISTVKSQMEYARLVEKTPCIKFMEDTNQSETKLVSIKKSANK